MLVLTRKSQERIRIGDNITISIIKVTGNKVRVGIEAPKDVRVLRAEISAFDAEPDVVAPSIDESDGTADAADVPLENADLAASAMQRFMDARRQRNSRLGNRRAAMQPAAASSMTQGRA